MWKLARLSLLLISLAGAREFYRRLAPEEPELPVEAVCEASCPAPTPVSIPERIPIAVPEPAPAPAPPPEEPVESAPEPRSPRAPLDLGELPAVGSIGGPAHFLEYDESFAWLSGRRIFAREWDARNGLGAPGFNAEGCATCHHDPVLGGAGKNDVNVMGLPMLEEYDPTQIPGNRIEALKQCREQTREQMPELASLFQETQTPSLLGVGLIDRIPERAILAREDPADLDGDGIRGVASRVMVGGVEEIGRFGWRAQTPRLVDFVRLALSGETGITVPSHRRGFGLETDTDGAADPEISEHELEDLVFYVASLAPPARGGGSVEAGERQFHTIGCAACHVPELVANDGRKVPLYSDLLLHDVLPDHSADVELPVGVVLKEVATSIRTPPLWGVADTAPYLHDGRAATLRAAILAHDEEARRSRAAFESLPDALQDAVVAFVEDL